jgi:hypothetical protein
MSKVPRAANLFICCCCIPGPKVDKLCEFMAGWYGRDPNPLFFSGLWYTDFLNSQFTRYPFF